MREDFLQSSITGGDYHQDDRPDGNMFALRLAEVVHFDPRKYTCDIDMFYGGQLVNVPIMMISGGPSSHHTKDDKINSSTSPSYNAHGDRRSYNEGDMVLVGFLFGAYEQPIILGAVLDWTVQKLEDQGLLATTIPGTLDEVADDDLDKEVRLHHSGQRVETDDIGVYTIFGVPNGSNKQAKMIVDSDGSIILENRPDGDDKFSKIKLLADGSITLENKKDGADKASLIVLKVDGSIDIRDKNSTVKVTIKDGEIDLGDIAMAALNKVVDERVTAKLNAFVTSFNSLVSTFNTHTHPVTTAPGVTGATTSPGSSASSFVTADYTSPKVKVTVA